MAQYADGFVIVIARENLAAYKKVAAKAARVWKEYGALSYYETVLEEEHPQCGKPFARLAKAGENEVVIFSWITYKSKSHRNKVNAAVMADPRIKMEDCASILDMKRFTFGGFDVMVRAEADK